MIRISSARAPRRGFTLVELLVVIGIIAVLISILLPTIARAQEASRRVNCLSNLRQVYTAYVFYAQDNHDQVPLGYRIGKKQFNSMTYSSTSKFYVEFGLLYQGGYMKTPRVFFCPSENNAQSMFNSDINPWPPGNGNGTGAIQGYCGYACRPDVEIPDNLADPANAKFRFPHLIKFKNAAILSDLTATVERVTTRHNRGINVLYGHGGAHWVERSVFNVPLSKCTALATTPNDPVINPAQDQIWQLLDPQ